MRTMKKRMRAAVLLLMVCCMMFGSLTVFAGQETTEEFGTFTYNSGWA